MDLRSKAYLNDWLSAWDPPVPCISIGNINWGGTGKTPLCQWLLRFFLDRGYLPALLSRGYKAKEKNFPHLLTRDSSIDQTGDEPWLLFQSAPEANIVVDPDRSRAGRWIWVKKKPDLYLLDDGFQHLAIKRDLDLLLLRREDLFQDWNQVIPGGSWRESKRSLVRSDAFLVNLEPKFFYQDQGKIIQRLADLDKPIFSFRVEPKGLINVLTGDQERLKGLKYILISGVGDPNRIRISSTEFLDRAPEKHLVYPDHHFYSQGDWQNIKKIASKFQASVIICTPKDSLKLKPLADENLFTFKLGLYFGPYLFSQHPFPSWLTKRLAQCKY